MLAPFYNEFAGSDDGPPVAAILAASECPNFALEGGGALQGPAANLDQFRSVVDYGIPVEPYLFLVDAEGDVFAKFEGVVGADELRGAIEDVLGRAT